MSSGKKEKVMIACSTFEVAKIVEPAKYYGIDRIYIIHYIRDKKSVYQEFYNEVCNQLKEWNPNLEIIEDYDKHKVYKFTLMMNDIMQIISKEREVEDIPDIYVNISSGTHEFTAAAVIASMMWDNTIAFTAPAEKYMVETDKDMRDVYFEEKDGVKKPIGLTKTTLEPIRLSGYSIPQPDHSLVIGLGVLRYRLSNKDSISAPNMIVELEKKHLIEVKRTATNKIEQKTIMKYQRNFVDKWIELGWAERISKRELKITIEGEQILRTFLDSFDPNHKCQFSDI